MDGDYSWECWSNGVKQEAGKSDFKRIQDYSKGTTTYVNSDDQTVTTDTQNGMYDQLPYAMVTVTTSKYQKLTDGNFKETADSQMTTTIDNNRSTTDFKYMRVFGVEQGMYEYNISVSNNGAPEQFGVGESAYNTMEDGRVSISGYVREKFSRPAQEMGEGQFTTPYLSLVSNSLCVYTKTK